MSAPRPTRALAIFLCGAAGLLGSIPAARAEDLAFSAQVDQTTVAVGAPLTLTLTMSGDLAGVNIPAFEFPDGLAVAARSQATNVIVKAGAAQRSTSLQYLLVAGRPGTYRLGPFAIVRQGQEIKTDPIDLTVEPPAAAPPPQRPAKGRVTL